MTHIGMSQSAKSYFRARRYDPFPYSQAPSEQAMAGISKAGVISLNEKKCISIVAMICHCTEFICGNAVLDYYEGEIIISLNAFAGAKNG